MVFVAKFGGVKPTRWEFVAAVGHILTAKDAEGQHLSGREVGLKVRGEVRPGGFEQGVGVALLHEIVDGDGAAELPV